MAFRRIFQRSTGWYDLTGFAPGVLSGRLLGTKGDGRAVIVFDELVLDQTGNVGFTRLPLELHPFFRVREPWAAGSSGGVQGTVNISPTGYFNIYGVTAGVEIGGRLEWELRFPENTDMPGVKL